LGQIASWIVAANVSLNKICNLTNATTKTANNPGFVLQLGNNFTYLMPLGSTGVNGNTPATSFKFASDRELFCYIPRDRA